MFAYGGTLSYASEAKAKRGWRLGRSKRTEGCCGHGAAGRRSPYWCSTVPPNGGAPCCTTLPTQSHQLDCTHPLLTGYVASSEAQRNAHKFRRMAVCCELPRQTHVTSSSFFTPCSAAVRMGDQLLWGTLPEGEARPGFSWSHLLFCMGGKKLMESGQEGKFSAYYQSCGLSCTADLAIQWGLPAVSAGSRPWW